MNSDLVLYLYALLGVLFVGFLLGVGKGTRSLGRLETTVARLERTVDRMEHAAATVAEDLAGTSAALQYAAQQRGDIGQTLNRMEAATSVVADNLADSVSRADATEGPDGAAADAALRTGDTAEAIHQRQGSQPDS